MPTYQYACTNPDCGNRFELVQTFTEPAADTCPVCASKVRKVYGSVGVVFKGSGFYRNDSRAGNGSGSGTAAKSSETKESKGSDSKESKGSDSSSSSSSSKDSSSSSKDSGSSSSSTSSSSSSSSSSGKAAASA